MMIQFDSGGGVGVGVIVTVVCSTESRDADRLPTRSRVTASFSGSPPVIPPAVPVPARAPVPAPRLPVLDVVATAPTVSSALLPAHCTAPPRPTVTDSHFCLPLFFFLRLKKQQHLEMKQTLIGLRVVPLAASFVDQHIEHAAEVGQWLHSAYDHAIRERKEFVHLPTRCRIRLTECV